MFDDVIIVIEAKEKKKSVRNDRETCRQLTPFHILIVDSCSE